MSQRRKAESESVMAIENETRRLIFKEFEIDEDVTSLLLTADANLDSFVKFMHVRSNVICVYLAKGWREQLQPYPAKLSVQLRQPEGSHD